MDSSWLVSDEINSDVAESEPDYEDIKTELESRLYSIVHYNDLSQPLPPQLAKHYSVHCEDDGKLVVELKDSLENIQSEETKFVDITVQNCTENNHLSEFKEVENNDAKEINVFTSDSYEAQETPRKIFRYSDINLDTPNNKELDKVVEGTPDNISYFKITPRFFNDCRTNSILKRMIIPPSFETPDSDWKQTANANFISFGPGKTLPTKEIIQQMVNDLADFNPSISKKKLYYFAHQVYYHNKKLVRQSEKKRRKRKAKLNISSNSVCSTELNEIISVDDPTNNSFKNKELISTNAIEKEEEKNSSQNKLRRPHMTKINGSISLNTSPFKPVRTIDLVSDDLLGKSGQDSSKRKKIEPLVQTIYLDSEENITYDKHKLLSSQAEEIWSSSQTLDLTVEDKVTSSHKISQRAIKRKRKRMREKILEQNFPTKWTEDMISFYTQPITKGMQSEISDIFNHLKSKSKPSDWMIDPRDKKGFYHRPKLTGFFKNLRCPNCRELGHLMQDCPKPIKIPTCNLCGEFYHNSFSCPNKICLKCGVYISNDAYECSACYYHTFNYDTPCTICGIVTHRAEICPDLWRSFHATTEGDKKIPERIIENRRKFCCNCSTRGHFSHDCPLPPYGGEQPSSFVSNYSASPCDVGTTEIIVPGHLSYIIENTETDSFLQDLSNTTEASIQVDEVNTSFVFKISGTFEQCRRVKSEIQGYVNSNKRKRPEGHFRRKRRRVR